MKKSLFYIILFMFLWNTTVAQQEKKVVCNTFPYKLGSSIGLGTISYTTLAGERVGPESFGFTVKTGVGWKLAGETLRGFAKFDISEIPKDAVIHGLRIDAECRIPSTDSNHRIEIHQMKYDPDEINESEYQDWLVGDATEKEKHKKLFNTMAKIYHDCGDGPLYASNWNGVTRAGQVSRALNSEAVKDLQESLTRGWFAIGFMEEGENCKFGSLCNLSLEARYTLLEKSREKHEGSEPSVMNWIPLKGDWEIGALEISQNEDSTCKYLIIKTNSNYNNLSINLLFRILRAPTRERMVGISFRGDPETEGFYYVRIYCGHSKGDDHLELRKITASGSDDLLATARIPFVEQGEECSLSVWATGERLTAKFNKGEIEATVEARDVQYHGGPIGLITYHTAAKFYRIDISKTE